MTFEAGVELPLYLSEGLRNVAAVHDYRDLKLGIVKVQAHAFCSAAYFYEVA